jgi:hypothetical protein
VYLCAAVATVTNRDGHGWFTVFGALDLEIYIEY